ncbi:MAG: hypothetical protein OEY11_12875 [Gammaproteobacteria bacterium]|nr:hypothetical protein [Gammaproteobacteria bacterium]
MEDSNCFNMSAAKSIAMSFGILAALGGMVHGVGEVLQGSVEPAGIFVSSWTQGPIALYFDGDPAITIIPDMFYTGVITLFVSLFMLVYAIAYLDKNNAGLVQIMLSVVLLLVGGGIGPPTLALLAGIAGLGINSRHSWWRKHVKANTQYYLCKAWPFVFLICLANGLFNVVGHVVAAYCFAPASADVFLNSFLLAIPLLVASIISGVAYDSRERV